MPRNGAEEGRIAASEVLESQPSGARGSLTPGGLRQRLCTQEDDRGRSRPDPSKLSIRRRMRWIGRGAAIGEDPVMASQPNGAGFTRRTLLAGAGGVAAATLLAACSTGGSKSGSSGNASQAAEVLEHALGRPRPSSRRTSGSSRPTSRRAASGNVTYQQIQWANFTQTFSTAVAANNGPAVSSGGGTTAFEFESQGKIAYADNLLDTLEEERHLRRLPPGPRRHPEDQERLRRGPLQPRHAPPLVPQGPHGEGRRRRSPPTGPPSRRPAPELKKIGVYGYGTRSGAGAFTGFHTLVSHMINNGGGLFDARPEARTASPPENIEAIDWVLGLVKNGYVDPRSATYTSQNFYDADQRQQVRHGLGRRRRSRERQRDRGAAAPGRPAR